MNSLMQYLKEIIYLSSDNIKKMPFLVFLFLLSSVLELLSVGLIAPYIALILDPEGTTSIKILSIFNKYNISELNSVIITIGFLLLGIFLIKTLLIILINKYILVFSHQTTKQIRGKLMSAFQGMPYELFLKRNSSEYVYSTLSLSAIFAESTIQSVLRIFSESIVTITLTIFLIIQYPLELFGFVLIASIFISIAKCFEKGKLAAEGKIIDDQYKTLVKTINESMHGFKDIRILNKENFFYDKVIKSSQLISDARIPSTLIKTYPRYILEFTLILFVVLLVLYTILLNKNTTELALVLGVFALSAMRITPCLNQIMSGITQLIHNRNSVSLLYKDIQLINEQHFHFAKNHHQIESFHEFSLKNITFSYNKDSFLALNNINLTIKKGASIGIMGTSGAGKSTLIDIILGLLKPSNGEINFNNKKLSKENLDVWLRNVAYIPQTIFITDDTIKRNIALGEEDHEINLEKIRESITKANLIELVHTLPQGIDAIIGERGLRLSGGQRQRIAIARAFYFDRDVFIFDEATSALDNNTESLIVDEIKQLQGTKTLIIIAHRLTTLRYCDIIYKIEAGKIIEQGSYQEMGS